MLPDPLPLNDFIDPTSIYGKIFDNGSAVKKPDYYSLQLNYETGGVGGYRVNLERMSDYMGWYLGTGSPEARKIILDLANVKDVFDWPSIDNHVKGLEITRSDGKVRRMDYAHMEDVFFPGFVLTGDLSYLDPLEWRLHGYGKWRGQSFTKGLTFNNERNIYGTVRDCGDLAYAQRDYGFQGRRDYIELLSLTHERLRDYTSKGGAKFFGFSQHNTNSKWKYSFSPWFTSLSGHTFARLCRQGFDWFDMCQHVLDFYVKLRDNKGMIVLNGDHFGASALSWGALDTWNDAREDTITAWIERDPRRKDHLCPDVVDGVRMSYYGRAAKIIANLTDFKNLGLDVPDDLYYPLVEDYKREYAVMKDGAVVRWKLDWRESNWKL